MRGEVMMNWWLLPLCTLSLEMYLGRLFSISSIRKTSHSE
jgi:hypothetical protein